MPGIEIVAYDEAWPERARAAMAEIRAALGGVLVDIEHIGSTAVPGMSAKPTIDLMAAVEDLLTVDGRALDRLGYEPRFNGMLDRLLFIRRTPDRRRTHILHVVETATWPHRNQRILRDHLRAHPEDAERYSRAKYAFATAPDYTRAKTELIQELTDRARAARGLPSVPVWEKG